MVLGIDDYGQVQTLRVSARETGIAISAPLHGRAHTVAVPEEEVVSHANLVAVVDDRRARQRKEQPVQQFDSPPVVAQQGGEATADANVDPHVPVVGVHPVHVVPLFVGHHFEGELIVVAQEHAPLATVRDLRCLLQHVDYGRVVLHAQCHEQPGHDREVERHVALVAVAKVGGGVFRPLVGLSEQHSARETIVDVVSQLAEDVVCLREVFAVRAVTLNQVRDGIQPQP